MTTSNGRYGCGALDEGKRGSEFWIYAVGIVHSSVCTSLPPEEMLALVNARFPTGISSRWGIADEAFMTGESNPCPCSDAETRETHKHYLLVC